MEIRYYFRNEPYSVLEHGREFSQDSFDKVDLLVKEKFSEYADRIVNDGGHLRVTLGGESSQERVSFVVQPQVNDSHLQSLLDHVK